MNWFSAPSVLLLSLASALVHAEPGPTTDPIGGGDAPPGSASEVGPSEPAGVEPRGELLQLSRQPQAELLVDVLLTSNDESSYFELVSEKNGASLIVCGTPCRFRIWPGRYRLITNPSSGYIGGANSLMIDGSSDVVIHQDSVFRPAMGAVLGVLGAATAIVGGFLLATNRCDSGCNTETARHSRLGVASLGAGLVVAPIGWLLFGQSRNPEINISPIDPGRTQ